ncbi:hypothetical protein NDU88_003934 [Pleurodeles waltl]|uniref:Uncharacterized protein n=1 Tax=Pleurodeles waltl TaxID=8319 RepID=A0AAV7VFM0_PLEWA|nr:hypothetical protein NDU88_003934 [Pleurodeles waltl]
MGVLVSDHTFRSSASLPVIYIVVATGVATKVRSTRNAFRSSRVHQQGRYAPAPGAALDPRIGRIAARARLEPRRPNRGTPEAQRRRPAKRARSQRREQVRRGLQRLEVSEPRD